MMMFMTRIKSPPLLLLWVALLCTAGCTTTKEVFREAALPLAADIHADQIQFIASDQNPDPQWTIDANALLDGAQAGDIDAVEVAWPRVKEIYLLYVDTDPRLDDPGGLQWQRIKRNTAATFDLILAKARGP